jgi:acyl carrier protein
LVAYIVPIHEPVSGSQKEKNLPATKMAGGASGNRAGNVLVDPLERPKFKLRQPGLRRNSGFLGLVEEEAVKETDTASEQPVSLAKVRISPPSTAYGGIADELREFLRGKLPEYMVPASFVFMDALPLSANGKVDRKALPKPEVGTASGKEYVAPRTDIERTIVEVWKEVLKQAQVGVHDDFFEVGGDSLLATQVMSRINRLFDIQLPLRRLFEARTIEVLAQFLDTSLWNAGDRTEDDIVGSGEREAFEL